MHLMKMHFCRILSRSLLFLAGLLLVTACTGHGGSDQSQPSKPVTAETKAAQSQPTITSPQSLSVQLDACSLLTKTEVEAAVGRHVLEPQRERVAELASCKYGDPNEQLIGGRVVSNVVDIGVFVGTDAAQARAVLEIARKNAAEVQPVSGLGDDAYWDQITRYLWVVKGRYEISINLASDAGGLNAAKSLAAKVLARLP